MKRFDRLPPGVVVLSEATTMSKKRIPATYTRDGVAYKVRYIVMRDDHEVAVMDISAIDAYSETPFGGQCGDELPVARLFDQR
jgi:hypothetical protein